MASVSSSNMSSVYNSLGIKNNGIGGLMSGLDTDSLVEALTSSTRAKIAKQGQQRQLLSWKQSAYRSVASTMRSFSATHFSFSSPATNIKANSFFNTYKGTSTSSKVTLASSTTTSVGSVKISEIRQLATSQTMTLDTAFTADLESGEFAYENTNFNGQSLAISVDGSNYNIRLDSLSGKTFGSDAAFEKALQDLVDKNVGKRSLSDKELAAMTAAEKTAAEAEYGSNTADWKVSRVTVDFNETTSGKGTLELDSTQSTIKVRSKCEALGLEGGETNRFDVNTKLSDIPQFAGLNGEDFTFKINGTSISVKSSDSLNTLLTRITNSSADVKASYSSVTEKITFTSKVTGTGNNIDIEDVTGNLMHVFVGAKGSSKLESVNENPLLTGFGDKLMAGEVTMDSLRNFLDSNVDKSPVLEVTIGDKTEKINLGTIAASEDGKWEGVDADVYLRNVLNGALALGFGDKLNGVSFSTVQSDDETKCTFTLNASPDVEVSIQQVSPLDTDEADAFSFLGFSGTSVDNTNMHTKLGDLVPGTSGSFNIQVRDTNGDLATIPISWHKNDDLKTLIDRVNTAAGQELITVKDGKLSLDMGLDPIVFSDNAPDGVMEKLFGFHDYDSSGDSSIAITHTEGKNAEIVVDGNLLSYSSNTITIDGLSFTINDVHGPGETPITITSESDADELIDKLQNFVDEYNVLIKTINTLINEKKASGYSPLTDEQKSEMTAEQIKNWETEAKKGILYNDSTLRGIVSEMQEVLVKKVDAAGLSLHEIGISSPSFMSGSSVDFNYDNLGTIEIDKEKLRSAIEQNPDGVRLLFTDPDDGVASSMESIITKAVNTSSGPNRGTLVTIAGADGLTGDNTSSLGNKIDSIDEFVSKLKTRLEQEYTRYWNKFSALETALSKLNAQSSWLTQNT